jgi:hypothetical protein
MSWTPKMVKETYKDGPLLKLKRLKTGRTIKVWFEIHEYPEIITKLNLDMGEILMDKEGTKIEIEGFPGPVSHWEYKPYSIKILV